MGDKIDFNAALKDCKHVRDGIKSDEDFQNADSGLVMYYLNTIVQALEIAATVKQEKRIVTKLIEQSQKHVIQNEVNETINDYLYDKDVTYCHITLRFEKQNGKSNGVMLIVGKSFYEEDGGL